MPPHAIALALIALGIYWMVRGEIWVTHDRKIVGKQVKWLSLLYIISGLAFGVSYVAMMLYGHAGGQASDEIAREAATGRIIYSAAEVMGVCAFITLIVIVFNFCAPESETLRIRKRPGS